MPEPISLLIVDDESAMRRVIRTSLRTSGYDVDEAACGERAVEALQRRPFTMVLLDINMPGMGGIEACRRIRQLAPATGIIMISVRDKEEDMVQALEAGADDYVTKPFRLRELVARLRAVRRRTRAEDATQKAIRRAGDLELDVYNRMLRKSGVEIHLSQKEFDILAFLMNRPDTPVPHARLLQAVWGPEYGGETEYLRTYIRHLRRKIERDAANPAYILTEPWVGYRFRNPDVPVDAGLVP
jgi:two-component system, OmpR family, KDP operon response regulator KdpE